MSELLVNKITAKTGTTINIASGQTLAIAGTLTQPAGSIATASLADDAITAAKLADNAVVAANIANDAVGAAAIADDAIVAAAIADDAVGAAAIADDAVGAAAIADDAIVAAAIADNAVVQAAIGDDAVGADQLAASAVGAAAIADNSITAAKISGSAAADAGTFLKKDGSWAAAGVTYPTNSVLPSVSSTGTGNDSGDVITLSGGTWANASTYEYRWSMRNANGVQRSIYNSTTSLTRNAGDSGYVIMAEVRATGTSGDRSKWTEASNRIGQFKKTYTDTGADQTFTVPTGVTSITIKAWGSMGGAEGGFAAGTIAVTADDVYKVVVGHNTADGYAGRRSVSTVGGLTGLFTGTASIDYESTSDQARAVIIAGGGGGGAGEGGGSSGGTGSGCSGCGGSWSYINGAPGGSQSGVGGAGPGGGGAAGLVMRGAHGSAGSYNDGGAGYFGGGGGGYSPGDPGQICCHASGGGGSGFVKSTMTSTSLVTGANEGDSDWVTGYARSNEGGTGHGAMIIWY